MSSLTRVYLNASELSGGFATVYGEDARHLTKVMRIREGEKLLVCDGVGGEYTATVTEIGRESVNVKLGEYTPLQTEPKCSLTLYQCLPKSDKMDLIVQKSVELGVTKIVPVTSERCISQPDRKSMMNKLERWNKIAYSAASQSHRAIIPEVCEPVSFEAACEMMQGDTSFLCWEDEQGTRIPDVIKNRENKGISFLVGPEGGISESEAELARSRGISPVTLGKRILRTETAAMYVLSALDILIY